MAPHYPDGLVKTMIDERRKAFHNAIEMTDPECYDVSETGASCFDRITESRVSDESSNSSVPVLLDDCYRYHFKVLKRALKCVVARRGIAGETSKKIPRQMELQINRKKVDYHNVTEVIPLRPYEPMISLLRKVIPHTSFGEGAEAQLALYVTEIGKSYTEENDYHSFARSTNVMEAVAKVFKSINVKQKGENTKEMHERTYGIPFDPIVEFTCLLVALVQDVRHPGVPNEQFAEENPEMKDKYGQSIAEKLSCDHAWELLMEDRFAALRSCIYGSVEELQRFRHLFLNALMGNDTSDKKLAKMRREQWTRAFRVEDVINRQRSMNRKATIVIHYLFLAANACHAMHNWEVYASWNCKLFFEMTSAWQYGRNNTEPATEWYETELRFFDGWILPLAEQLKGIGIFGALGDSNLEHAKENRARWEMHGRKAIAAMETAFENHS